MLNIEDWLQGVPRSHVGPKRTLALLRIAFEGLRITCGWTTLPQARKREQSEKEAKHSPPQPLAHRLNPEEASVVELTLARLVNKQSVVLELPRVAIPGEVLAAQAVSARVVSFVVLFDPVGRPKALGVLQES